MSNDQYLGGSVASIVRIPRQRDRRRIEQASAVVEDWLDAQATDELDLDAEALDQITELALEGASEQRIAEQVRLARAAGWSWAPIAVLLGITRDQARARFTEARL